MGTRVSADCELPSATERVARFRLYFRDVPLAELVDAELLTVDREREEVTAGRRFEEGWNEMASERRPPDAKR